MEFFLAVVVIGLLIWFISAVAKSDAQREQIIQKQICEKQVELWEMQARLGQEVNIEKDLDRLYGLDKAREKARQKQETKDIIKGAVAGGIIAGDAGAVVGAMVAKNKIDNNRTQNNSSYSPTYNTYSSNYQSQYSPSIRYDEDEDLIKLYVSEREQHIDDDGMRDVSGEVKKIKSKLTGNLEEDCLTALKELHFATVTDVLTVLTTASDDYLEFLTNQKTSIALRQLHLDKKLIERADYERRAYYYID